MLSHLRHTITIALAHERSATLATYGPAGLQAQVVPCAASGTRLYLLLPRTSDQLLNLESDPLVIVVTAAWQLHGAAQIRTIKECPADLAIREAPGAPWSVIVEVQPKRITLTHAEGWGASETIDL